MAEPPASSSPPPPAPASRGGASAEQRPRPGNPIKWQCVLYAVCKGHRKRGRDPLGVYPTATLCNSCRCKRRRIAAQEKTRAALVERAGESDEGPRIRTRFLGQGAKARAKAESGPGSKPGAAAAAAEPDSALEEESEEEADSGVSAVHVVPAAAPQASLRPSSFPPELTASEAYKAEAAYSFSACNRGKELGWAYTWLHRRGRMEAGCGDGGMDLMVREDGALPCVLLSGAHKLSQVAWAPDGDGFAIQCDKDLLHICLQGVIANVATWLRLPDDEEFVGSPVWIGVRAVLFATSGGSPKRHRLYAMEEPPTAGSQAQGPGRMLLFEATKGGELLGWEQSPTQPLVAIVHRLANASLAQVILLQDPSSAPVRPMPGDDQVGSIQRIVAIDGRVEYCKPQLAFLADGRLIARLNLVKGPISGVDTSSAQPLPATHGLWILSDLSSRSPEWEPIKVRGDVPHGSYDVFSGSYAGGMPGEGFVLDTAREVVVVTTRKQSVETVSDELWLVRLGGPDAKSGGSGSRVPLPREAESKGCHVPVAVSGSTLIYHFRSPTEWGDLWRVEVTAADGSANPMRLTSTMPQSLRLKLSSPEEVVVPNGKDGIHALIFRPAKPSKERLQPLVWIHGGPSSIYAYDYNPLLNWLANLGYLVCVPNYRGSVGFGLDFMDAVLGDGCGVVDHQDCVACSSYLQELGKEDRQLDLRRGVGVAGHSWGGYLTLMCMLRGAGEGKEDLRPFSAGVASASITDFVMQQRGTEVRYFDFALMGGWVYEPSVAARAARASPVTYAAGLRGPLLVLHGEEDRDVPYEQIGPFVEAAKKAPHPLASVTSVTYPGCGHGVSGWTCAAQSGFLRQLRDFLRVNLKPWDFTDNPHGDLTTY